MVAIKIPELWSVLCKRLSLFYFQATLLHACCRCQVEADSEAHLCWGLLVTNFSFCIIGGLPWWSCCAFSFGLWESWGCLAMWYENGHYQVCLYFRYLKPQIISRHHCFPFCSCVLLISRLKQRHQIITRQYVVHCLQRRWSCIRFLTKIKSAKEVSAAVPYFSALWKTDLIS